MWIEFSVSSGSFLAKLLLQNGDTKLEKCLGYFLVIQILRVVGLSKEKPTFG